MKFNNINSFAFNYFLLVIIVAVIMTFFLLIGSFQSSNVSAQYAGNESSDLAKALDLHVSGNHTGAIEYYDKALAIEPNDPFILSSKALALEALGNHTGAIEYYDKALAIEPRDSYVLSNKQSAISKLNLLNQVVIRNESVIPYTPVNASYADLSLTTHLVGDPELRMPEFNGALYGLQTGVHVNSDHGQNHTDIHPLIPYAPNSVEISDDRMGVYITFKIPIAPKSTAESIERIGGIHDIKYIDTKPNYTKYIAFSNLPITINNTNYSNLTFEVKMYNNGTGYLYIDAYKN